MVSAPEKGHTLPVVCYTNYLLIILLLLLSTDLVRRPCLFLSDHQMTHPRQWTCQEQSADMVANFGSMYKISPSDAKAQ